MAGRKQTRKQKPTLYNLRAAQFLTERSRAVANSNLKVLRSKRNKRLIARTLGKTRRAR